jgi:hypothetical protein
VSTQPTVAVPTIAPNGGNFDAPVNVSLATTPGDANIYYTVNGTDPDESSTRYTTPFTIETTTQVRARAFKPGYNESGIASALFVFAGPGILEVLPTNGYTASGTMSGPFIPPSSTYVLTNSGGMSMTWTASVSQSWVSLSRTTGALAPGTASNIIVSLNAGANSLPIGTHNATVTFATTNGTLLRPVQLTISPIQLSLARVPASGTFEITLQGQSNVTYVIEASTNLVQWTPVGTNIVAPTGFLKHIEADSSVLSHRFYRGRPHQ